MDQGIIQNLKVLYRKEVVERILQSVDAGNPADDKSITVLDGIRMLHNAWHQVTAETIANCFRHAGFTPLAATVGDSEVPAGADAAGGITSSDPGNIWDRLEEAFHPEGLQSTPITTKASTS